MKIANSCNTASTSSGPKVWFLNRGYRQVLVIVLALLVAATGCQVTPSPTELGVADPLDPSNPDRVCADGRAITDCD